VSGTAAGLVFLALFVLALAAVGVPLGDYMYRVYISRKHSRTETNIHLPTDRGQPGLRADLENVCPYSAGAML
jgi:hypothetical protein